MKRLIIYPIFYILLLFTGCNSCPELTKSANGLYLENGKPFTGKTICDCDGNVKDDETELLNYKDGLIDGLNEQYIDDNLTLKAFYKNGILDSVFEIYVWDGTNMILKSKKIYKNGILDGYSEIYNWDGILESKKCYKDGKIADGIYLLTEWGGQQLHKADGVFKNGKFNGVYKYYTNEWNRNTDSATIKDSIKDVQWEEYYSPTDILSNAKIVLKENYKDGIKEGLHEEYYFQNSDSKSILQQKGSFKSGQKDGVWETYYDNGKLAGKSIYKNGEIDGFMEGYYGSGQLESKEIYNDEKTIIGKESYYITGELNAKSSYKNRKLSSVIYYHRNGKETKKSIYRNGLLSKREEYYKNGKISKIDFFNVDKDKDKNVKSTLTEYYNERGKLTSKEIRKGGKLFSKAVYNNGNFEYIEFYKAKN